MAHPGLQGGDWENGLCDCSCGTCIVSCFTPCLLIGRTSDRLRDPSSMANPQTMNGDCFIHGTLYTFTGLFWIYTMIKRTEIRERFGIRGSTLGDCCATFWCHCCAVVQQENEVKSRLAKPSGPIQTQYQPQQQQMTMAPQNPPPVYGPPQQSGNLKH
ncbi:PLAC8-domain-containing protein [Hypomontagnella monticulosa]|nr:PLAC8-domain-containing protein [Hypomontagnella monticulosa]